MRIVFASSELAPYASTGVFGEAVQALTGELAQLGHDVSVVLPYYRAVRDKAPPNVDRVDVKFSVQVGPARYPVDVYELPASNGVQVFLVARDEFFDRSGLYGVDDRDYQDNAARFVFLSRSVIELVRRMDPAPDVLHAQNWQTALVPVYASEQHLRMRTVLTAHSLEFQGNFWSYDFGLTTLPGEFFSSRGLEYYGSMNLLKGGIVFAESVVLPGPRWVAEAQTQAHGCGLDPVLREQAWKLEGITNGVSSADWNPASDQAIAAKYDKPEGKKANRDAWAARLGISPSADSPLLLLETTSMISDGMGVLLPALDRILESGVCLTILGDVSTSHLAQLVFDSRKHRSQLGWMRTYTENDFRQALAASDAMVFPEPVHPSVDSLLKGLRYGTVPITAACGGLHALAPDIGSFPETGYGFSFFVPSGDALADCIKRSSRCFTDTKRWNHIALRAMQADFSWGETAREYEQLYASLVARSGGARAA